MPIVIDSATISTSEYSLPGDTTTGVPTAQTDDVDVQGWVQMAAMGAGGVDVFRLRVYEKVNGQTAGVAHEAFINDSTPTPIPSLRLGEGWDITLLKITGTDRVGHWSLRKIPFA